MATLAVHEAMGAKVDREATATLVLPQLWAMSMGPCMSAGSCQIAELICSTERGSVWSVHDVSLQALEHPY